MAVATSTSSRVKPAREVSERRVANKIEQLTGSRVPFVPDDAHEDLGDLVEPGGKDLALPSIARITLERPLTIAQACRPWVDT